MLNNDLPIALPPPLPKVVIKWPLLRFTGYVFCLLFSVTLPHQIFGSPKSGFFNLLNIIATVAVIRTLSRWFCSFIYSRINSPVLGLLLCFSLPLVYFIVFSAICIFSVPSTLFITGGFLYLFLTAFSIDIPIRLFLAKKKGLVIGTTFTIPIGFAYFTFALLPLLILVFIVSLTKQSSVAAAHASPPLPPTRVEEMQQRIDAYVKKGGASQPKQIIELSKGAMTQLETSARRMVELNSTINVSALQDIKAASAADLNTMIDHFSQFQSAGQLYYDTLKVHRDIVTASINATNPKLLSVTLKNTENNYNLTRQWGLAAIESGKAGLAYLRAYEKNRTDSTQAFNDMISALKHYEELQNTVLSISKANQNKLEKALPR